MRFKSINIKKLRRVSAFILAGTFAASIISVAKNRDIIGIRNEFTKGIYCDEDVKRNRENFYDRLNGEFNDKEKSFRKE